MPYRATQKIITGKFKTAAALLGWNIEEPYSFSKELGRYVANVGTYCLDYNAAYGGYRIEQITNSGGAWRDITGRKPPREFVEWLDGAIFAAYEIKKQSSRQM